MRLRSTAPALLLQSPVQRAGRVIGFPDAERRAAARNGWEGAFVFVHYSLYVYIRHKSGPIPRRIRIESFGAGDAHIATRFAAVAPQGAIQTLGEHGLLCGTWGRHARHGAPFRGSASLVNWRLTARRSDLTPLARLPRRPERRSNRPDSPQILTTIHYQTFFASKGSVCWSLLVPAPALFR